jgi:hypothetical protein
MDASLPSPLAQFLLDFQQDSISIRVARIPDIIDYLLQGGCK